MLLQEPSEGLRYQREDVYTLGHCSCSKKRLTMVRWPSATHTSAQLGHERHEHLPYRERILWCRACVGENDQQCMCRRLDGVRHAAPADAAFVAHLEPYKVKRIELVVTQVGQLAAGHFQHVTTQRLGGVPIAHFFEGDDGELAFAPDGTDSRRTCSDRRAPASPLRSGRP